MNTQVITAPFNVGEHEEAVLAVFKKHWQVVGKRSIPKGWLHLYSSSSNGYVYGKQVDLSVTSSIEGNWIYYIVTETLHGYKAIQSVTQSEAPEFDFNSPVTELRNIVVARPLTDVSLPTYHAAYGGYLSYDFPASSHASVNSNYNYAPAASFQKCREEVARIEMSHKAQNFSSTILPLLRELSKYKGNQISPVAFYELNGVKLAECTWADKQSDFDQVLWNDRLDEGNIWGNDDRFTERHAGFISSLTKGSIVGFWSNGYRLGVVTKVGRKNVRIAYVTKTSQHEVKFATRNIYAIRTFKNSDWKAKA